MSQDATVVAEPGQVTDDRSDPLGAERRDPQCWMAHAT